MIVLCKNTEGKGATTSNFKICSCWVWRFVFFKLMSWHVLGKIYMVEVGIGYRPPKKMIGYRLSVSYRHDF